MNADGSDPRRLTATGGRDIWPAWSADGTQIAFVSVSAGGGVLHVMDADGGNRQQFPWSQRGDWEPAWSPIGSEIAFSGQRGGKAEIYVEHADGVEQGLRNLRQITDNDVHDVLPVWSPDGTQIAFTSERDGNWEIHVMAADGSNPRRLTYDDADDIVSDWSPAGAELVFMSDRDGDWEIYVLKADGSDLRQVTTNEVDDMDPAWSPDGTQIVYQSNRGGNWAIYVMTADGSNPQPLTSNAANDVHPVWWSDAALFAPAVPPAHASVGDTWTRPTDGMVMVYVPGGTFQMGSTEAEIEAELSQCNETGAFCAPKLYRREAPAHTVTLDGFWMDQTEVTNAKFAAFLNEHGNRSNTGGELLEMEAGYCRIRQVGNEFQSMSSGDDHPVVMVSWYGAEAYCQWAGGRLPTEAEWEYAARGPEGHLYPWGDEAPTCELANFGTCTGTTKPVDAFPDGVSWCGVLDMAGNAWEWVADWYGGYSSGRQENPTGPSSGWFRVVRGGGWHSPPRGIRAAFRLDETGPGNHIGCIGFRCVVPANE